MLPQWVKVLSVVLPVIGVAAVAAMIYTESIALAVVVSMVSNALFALGTVIVKVGQMHVSSNATNMQLLKLFKDSEWRTGMVLMYFAGVLYPMGLGYGPVTLIMALWTSVIPFTVAFSCVIIESTVTHHTLLGIVGIVLLVMIMVISAPEETTDSSDITRDVELLSTNTFIACMGVVSVLFVSLLLWRCMDTRRSSRFAIAALLRGMVGAFVAVVGRFFLWSVKETIAGNLSGSNSTTRIVVYLIVWLLLGTYQEYVRQQCIACSDAVRVAPTVITSMVVFGTVIGGIVFEEFDSMDYATGVFGAAMVASIACVVYINSENDTLTSDTPSFPSVIPPIACQESRSLMSKELFQNY